MFNTMLLAQAAGGSDPKFMLIWLGLMIAIFYVILIRPQKRREKERRAMLSDVKTGDRIIFCGGLIGIVTNAKEKTLAVKAGDKVKVEILRSAVAQVLGEGDLPEAVEEQK